jgi:DNA-nicking Smr family endonuclease
MARKKRRPAPSSPQPVRNGHFHTPFDDLKALLRDAGTPSQAPPAPPQGQRRQQPAPAQNQPAPPRKPAPSEPAERQRQHDQAFFLAEMAGVQRLAPDPRGRIRRRRTPPRHPRQRMLDDLSILTDLQDLVDGRGEFSIQYTDEYMEGVAPNVDRRLTQRLHHGDFAVQGHLDLHGHTVDEARGEVERFLVAAYARGQRCVRLVHGRGRNSPDNRPVLKEQVRFWLSHGRLSRLILAFATAPTADGGAGAVYVLLRRSPRTMRR